MLTVDTDIEASFNVSSLPEPDMAKQPPGKLMGKRFNKFGEEVVSLKDIFPNKHPGMTLKGFRQRDNMTQQQLADVLSIRRSRVRDLESGARPISVEMAKRIGSTFNISYKIFL